MVGRQIRVLAGMAVAVAVLVLLWKEVRALPLPLPDGDDISSRIAYVAKWLLLPGTCLLVGIAIAASRRFFVADAIDGTRAPEDRLLEITLRYIQNTLEQTVLVGVAWTGLALELPHDRLSLIAALAVLFVVARALFWSGYLIAPWARAVGFALTFFPTVTVFIWLLARTFA